MPKIVEPDFPHPQLFQQVRKVVCHIGGLDQRPQLVDADVVVKFPVIAPLAYFPVHLPLFLLLLQHFNRHRRQREGPPAGLIFHVLHRGGNRFVILRIRHDLGFQQDGLLFEVDPRPSRAQVLARTQGCRPPAG